MTWAIVADSSCNLRDYTPTAPDTVYLYAPLKVTVSGHEFVDSHDIDMHEYFTEIETSVDASSTACPSVGEWKELFEQADNVIVVPISSQLSGSLEAAETAKTLLHESTHKNIHIVDSHAAGGKLELIVELIDRYLTAHPQASFGDVCTYADEIEAHSQVLYSLSSYANLTKAGRMPKIAGLVANKLNIRVLGTATPEGTMKILGPSRGEKKMQAKIIAAMESDGFNGGDVFIDYVNNEAGAQALANRIVSTWSNASCHVLPCGALCSFYAENNGLIIGYGWDIASGL